LSSIFTLASYLLGKEHRETVSALKNLIYERTPEDNIFVLFTVINGLGDDIEALHALRNVVNDSKFVNLQTELLFKLIINLDDRDQEILNAIKNLITSSEEPNLFLLFKILQAIDTKNESIATLKSVTAFKTNILKLAHQLTEEKYTIPLNLKNMIKSFEGEVLTDSLSRGQLRSKIWVSDTINNLDIELGDMVYVCAGWYGILPAILFERNKVDAIRSFDIDPSCSLPAETLNRNYVQDDWKFKASTMDVNNLIYTGEFMYETLKYNGDKEMITDGAPSCIINTSCEHIDDFDTWWNNIPTGMLVIMQNNDFDDEDEHGHADSTVSSLEEWTKILNVSETLYEGTLALDKYNRYMVIGIK